MNLIPKGVAGEPWRDRRNQPHIVDHEVVTKLQADVPGEVVGDAPPGSTAVCKLFTKPGIHLGEEACASERVEFDQARILLRRFIRIIVCIIRSLPVNRSKET